jgi:peptidoglycan hydrolase CwlO-like protein
MFKNRAVKTKQRHILKKISKLAFLLIFSLSIFAVSSNVGADNLGDKQRELSDIQKKIGEYEGVITQKQGEAASLQSQIAVIDASLEKTKLEIRETETKIEKTQLEIDDTKEKIDKKQKEMDEKKKILKGCIKTTYEQEKISTLEILISSSSLSDFMDQLEYVSVVEDKTKGIYDEVRTIKEELVKCKQTLEGKKGELVKLRNEEESEKQTLEGQIAAKQVLLTKTQEEKSNYEGQLADASARASSVRRAIDLEYSNRDTTGRGGRYYGNGNLVISNNSWYHYYQTDSRWAGMRIGNSSSSVGDYGCALTSVTMVATAKGRGTTPAALASFTPAFYGDLIIWGIAGQFTGMTYHGSGAGIDGELARGNPVIVHVNIGHYVVISGRSGDTYYVDDPFFSGGSYSMSQIDQVVVYK